MKMGRRRNCDKQRSQRVNLYEGKILYKLWTRSGYVTVRSLTNGSNSNVSNGTSQSSSKKTSRKRSIGNISSRPSEVDSKPKDSCEVQLVAALSDASFIKTLKEHWKRGGKLLSPMADFISNPFKVVTLHQLFDSKDYLQNLTKEVSVLDFQRLNNDLYSFEQTKDLFESDIKSPAIKSFLRFLKGSLFRWMQNVTGQKLSGKVTATGSKYLYTDHLLCHDDNLSDRSIAFILYLSENWNESDGGSLQLFKCNNEDQPDSIVYDIVPSFGSFAFFEVTTRSYHHVQEVFSKDKVRLSINGWFHGDELPLKAASKVKNPKFYPPLSPKGCSFEKWVKPSWLNTKNHPGIKSTFCSELSVSLPEFLLKDMYQNLENAMTDKNIVWVRCGPAHQRNYERAKLSSLPTNMQNFLKLLQSKFMFYFLSEITVDIDPDSDTTPLCHIEVQRWSPGDYTLIVDNDPISDITGIDLHLYFNLLNDLSNGSREGGAVHYLGPDKNSDGFLEQNAKVLPEGNSLFLVANIAGMKRVTKYIDHDQNLQFHKIIATYSQG